MARATPSSVAILSMAGLAVLVPGIVAGITLYLHRVEERDGKLVNIDFDMVPMVKDPWKEENPAK